MLGVSTVLCWSGDHHNDGENTEGFVTPNLLPFTHNLPAADQSVGIFLPQLSPDDVDEVPYQILSPDPHSDPLVISDIFTCELHARSLFADVETVPLLLPHSRRAGGLSKLGRKAGTK